MKKYVYTNIAIFSSLIVALLLAMYLQSLVIDGLRGYVLGEGIYAASQKDAVIFLIRYTESHEEAEFRQFVKLLEVPEGSHIARNALQLSTPDNSTARKGFLQAQIPEDDINGMIWLYRVFNKFPYVSDVTALWERGDVLIDELRDTGLEIRSAIGHHNTSRVEQLIARVVDLNQEIADIESQFASKIDEGVGWFKKIMLFGRILLFIIAIFLSLFIGRRMLQTIAREEQELNLRKNSVNEMIEKRTAELEATMLALNESELHLKGISEVAMDAIVEIDVNGNIAYWNAAAERMFGYTSNEACGRNLHSLLAPEPQATTGHEAYMRYAQSGIPTRVLGNVVEVPGKRKDGTVFPLELSVSAIQRRGVRGALAIMRDITERKRHENELMELQKKAEAASRAKSEFLANMSHEIRTPMNAIIGMSYLAMEQDLNSEARNCLEKVSRSATALLNIINDILDLSKIEAGKLDMEIVDFNLDEEMHALADIINLRAEEKGVELLFEIEPDVPVALIGDPYRLEQILINLGNNAVKFTDRGGEVYIHVELASEQGGAAASEVKLHFSVRDTGIGIPENAQAKLFQAFSQADTSTTRKFGGTGLGLIIAKQLVEMMAGEVWFESKSNVGTTFHVTAVFGKQAVQPEPVHFSENEQQALNVLIVDDNATSRAILAHQLSHFGFHAEQADSGDAAIEMLTTSKHAKPYDLVLMDWCMPGLDGIETTRRIQRSMKLAHIPTVIMISAHNRVALEKASKDIKVTSLLSKPITPSALHDAIQESLGHAVTVRGRKKQSSEIMENAISRLAGLKVLLVEDNEINQELALELLTSKGIEVDCADDGMQAVDKVLNNSYAGVLMDCQMPVMDGYQATLEIRKHERYAQLPIIAMTANVMMEDRQRALDVGMNDLIAKPIVVSEMFATMAKWMSGAGDVSSVAAQTEGGGTDSLWRLPGIDVAAGLDICMKNERLYRRLLVKFRGGQQEFEHEFQAALEGEKHETAARIAHTLKGVAGNLGMKDLSHAAKELEVACLNRANDVEELFQSTLGHLRLVLDGLSGISVD